MEKNDITANYRRKNIESRLEEQGESVKEGDKEKTIFEENFKEQ